MMTINLPVDLENSILAVVRSGRFASPDEAMVEAARLLLRELESSPTIDPSGHPEHPGPGLIGVLRDDAALLDQAVELAMKIREERPWRANVAE